MAENDLTQQEKEDELPGWTEQPEGEETFSSQATSQSNSKPPSQKLAGISGFLVLAIIIVATLFYLGKGKPLIELPVSPPPSSAQQANPSNQAAPIAEPAFILLGEYGGNVYTYKQREKKVYVYNWKDKEEPVCKLVDFDIFRWHSSGKLLVISRRNNTQGGIYLVDLTNKQNAQPEQVLITDREAAPYFPRNLSIEESLPLAWSDKGESFAFVARDIHDKTQSLFIYNLVDKQQNAAQPTNPPVSQNTDKLIYTPARHFERITDLVWIKNDSELVFTAHQRRPREPI